MQVEVYHGAGIDIHKDTAVVTIRHQVPNPLTPIRQETRTFRTLTEGLHALRAWLVEEGITHVCLESTGSYWKPVYNLLEDTVVVWLINPSHIKPLRGRAAAAAPAELFYASWWTRRSANPGQRTPSTLDQNSR
jgi:transposase